jgi:regulator of cell morphogenesis and NO signaling
MRKEESVLFPAIVRLEAQTADSGTLPRESFGSLRHPLSMMEHEHDDVAQYLDEMRDLTYGYSAPEDAGLNLRNLYQELAALEADIHAHVHLENNILFARAAQLAREARPPD